MLSIKGSSINHDSLPVLSNSRIRLLVVLCCASAGLWLLFAKLAVPPIIETVYRGESFSLLNAAIRGQAEFPLQHYLQKWDRITMVVLWSGLAFWLLAIITSGPAFFKKFVGEATPGSVGAIRMWVCAILLITTMWEDLASVALLPLDLREGMGVMKIFDELPIGYQSFLSSAASLRVFQWTTVLLLFLGMIGCWTRAVVPLAALCALLLNGILREYSGFWHQNLVPIYVLAVLSLTACGDGWSIDRLRKISQGRPVPEPEVASARYGWARYACWVAIALPYVAAGMSKLRSAGIDWMSVTNMKNMLFEQTLYPKAGNWSIALSLASAPDIVWIALGVAGSIGEVAMIFLLFSRIARRFYPAMMIFMHVGIIFLMNIVFLDLILILLVFYDFTMVRKRVGTWLGADNSLQLLYDGSCPLCRRTVRILTCLDLFRRLEFHDFRRLDIDAYKDRHKLNLRPEDLEKEMYVISRGRAYGGFSGYRVIALALPVFWPIAPFLFLPGVATLGTGIYQFVARHRLRLVSCDSRCAIERAQPEIVSFTLPSSSARYNLSYGVLLAGLIAVMASIWVQSIEYYPFTAMPMFTGTRKSVVTYFKTLGHHESGVVAPVYLEDTIGAWSINSRYEALFSLCFSHEPRNLDTCKKTLAVLGSEYNKRTRPDEKLSRYEIQRWKWDFDAHPKDPNYGQLDARFIVEIPSDGSPQKNSAQSQSQLMTSNP